MAPSQLALTNRRRFGHPLIVAIRRVDERERENGGCGGHLAPTLLTKDGGGVGYHHVHCRAELDIHHVHCDRVRKLCGVGHPQLCGVGHIWTPASAGVVVGAAVGSAASQGVAIALDLQDSFSWKAVGSAALTSLIAPSIPIPGGDKVWQQVLNAVRATAQRRVGKRLRNAQPPEHAIEVALHRREHLALRIVGEESVLVSALHVDERDQIAVYVVGARGFAMDALFDA